MSSAESPTRVVRRLVEAEPSHGGDQPDAAGWLQRLCRAAATALPAEGVAVSVMTDVSDRVTAAASDPDFMTIDDAQFVVGEGPCLDSFARGEPVLAPDLEAATARWPAYVATVRDHGVRAVFAFPLLAGDTSLGALDVYRSQPGSLSTAASRDASAFALVALGAVLDAVESSRASGAGAETFSLSGQRLELFQAQGLGSDAYLSEAPT